MKILDSALSRLRARNSFGDPEEFRATLVEHLDELRVRIIRSIGILVVGAVLGWFAQPYVYREISQMAGRAAPEGIEVSEIFLTPGAAFMLALKLAILLGLILTLPLIVIQVWGFIAPGLKPNERKPFVMIGPLSVVLFAIGAFFAWQVMPATFEFLFSYAKQFPGANWTLEAGTTVMFVLQMVLLFGAAFQLPIVVFFLARIGLLDPDGVKHYWRQAIVIVFFAGAILTPSADPVSMTMMAAPLTILFFLSIFAAKVTMRTERDPVLNQLD